MTKMLKKLFNPAWDKILRQIINLLFLFFGKRIKQFKAVIVNVLTLVLGAIGILSATETFDFFCSLNLEVFCGGEQSLVYGYILAFIGVINLILDKVGADEIGENPAALKFGKNPLRPWAIFGLIALIALIISLFFV